MMPSPILIPLVGTIAGCGMIVLIVAITFWNKTRTKELDIHREMRLREMEHERGLKDLEIQKAKIELEKARVSQSGASAPR